MNEPVPQLLIIDDEPPVREFLAEALEPSCAVVTPVDSLPSALKAFETRPYDVLLADICMPGGTGLDLLALARQLNWDCAVILMTGHAELEHVVAGVRLQAADLLLKPFSLDALQHSISQSFQRLQATRAARSEDASLRSGLRERTRQLELVRSLLTSSHRSALESLVATLDAREHETYAHSFRVRAYTLQLAAAVQYPADELEILNYAALLHDIGKVAISDSILLKPGPLTPKEFQMLKVHSVAGERIVERMGFLQGAGTIIRHHHERWDGRGYPDGIAGPKIPLASRLFAVADTLDAMTSDRCYRKALTLLDARREIERCSGTQFDPSIVRAFCAIPDPVLRSLRQQADDDAQAAIIPEIGAPPGVPAPSPLSPAAQPS
jgi:putative nucleotidyltransferase with HDIG domain